MKSSHTIYNYKYFLSDLFFSSGINKRKLLILDEAHTLESEISSFKNFILNLHLIVYYNEDLMQSRQLRN